MSYPEPTLYIEIAGGGAKGETILVHLPTGQWGLIDCFSRDRKSANNNETISRLRELKVSTLEFVALTHPHDDHFRGMSRVLEAFPPRQFWQFAGITQQYLEYLIRYKDAEADALRPGASPDSAMELREVFDAVNQRIKKKDLDFHYLSEGKTLIDTTIDINNEPTRLTITSMAPYSSILRQYENKLSKCFEARELRPELTDIDHNMLSAAFVISYGATRVVLGGDVLAETWECILEHAPQHISCVDAVKVSHHGSTNGYCPNLWPTIAASQKPIAIITPFLLQLPAAPALRHIREFSSEVVVTGLAANAQAREQGFHLSDRTPPEVVEMLRIDARSATSLTPTAGRCCLRFDHDGNILETSLHGGAGFVSRPDSSIIGAEQL